MIERRPWLDLLAHLILVLGLVIVAFPLYVAFVASTQTAREVANAPISLLPGTHFIENYTQVLFTGSSVQTTPVGNMLWVLSLIHI